MELERGDEDKDGGRGGEGKEGKEGKEGTEEGATFVSMPPPNVWGPALWGGMQAMAFAYPIAVDLNGEHRHSYFRFLEAIETLLPCKHCRKHYRTWRADVASSPASPIFDGRESLSRAIVSLHNDVRRQQKKSTRTYEEVSDRYTGSKSSCPVGVGVGVGGGGSNNGDGVDIDWALVGTILIVAVMSSALAAMMCSKKSHHIRR